MVLVLNKYMFISSKLVNLVNIIKQIFTKKFSTFFSTQIRVRINVIKYKHIQYLFDIKTINLI